MNIRGNIYLLNVTICQSKMQHSVFPSVSLNIRLLHQKSVCVMTAIGGDGLKSVSINFRVLGLSDSKELCTPLNPEIYLIR